MRFNVTHTDNVLTFLFTTRRFYYPLLIGPTFQKIFLVDHRDCQTTSLSLLEPLRRRLFMLHVYAQNLDSGKNRHCVRGRVLWAVKFANRPQSRRMAVYEAGFAHFFFSQQGELTYFGYSIPNEINGRLFEVFHVLKEKCIFLRKNIAYNFMCI